MFFTASIFILVLEWLFDPHAQGKKSVKRKRTDK